MIRMPVVVVIAKVATMVVWILVVVTTINSRRIPAVFVVLISLPLVTILLVPLPLPVPTSSPTSLRWVVVVHTYMVVMVVPTMTSSTAIMVPVVVNLVRLLSAALMEVVWNHRVLVPMVASTVACHDVRSFKKLFCCFSSSKSLLSLSPLTLLSLLLLLLLSLCWQLSLVVHHLRSFRERLQDQVVAAGLCALVKGQVSVHVSQLHELFSSAARVLAVSLEQKPDDLQAITLSRTVKTGSP